MSEKETMMMARREGVMSGIAATGLRTPKVQLGR
jgi:hypothetical protein